MAIDPNFTSVFVSHASKDAGRASAIAKFLSQCLAFKDYEIACTSAPGFGLPFGAKFEDSLRTSIKKCNVFVALITENSLGSLFCTMEMGAAWGRGKPLKLVLAPHMGAERLQRPLSSFHAVRWSDAHAWLQLVAEVEEETGVRKRAAEHWPQLANAIAADL